MQPHSLSLSPPLSLSLSSLPLPPSFYVCVFTSLAYYTQIGNQSTNKMTYSDAMAAIDAFGMKGEECIITVTGNEEGEPMIYLVNEGWPRIMSYTSPITLYYAEYAKLPPGARDNFFVK